MIRSDLNKTIQTLVINFTFYSLILVLYFILNNKATLNDVNIFVISYSWTIIIEGIILGISTGYRILGSYAYGKQKYYLIGIFFQKTMIINLLFMLIVFIINFNSRKILNIMMAKNEYID
jgi:Na+-driven multidrug efflux pump